MNLGVNDLPGKVDFALVFGLVHELRDARRFLEEIRSLLKPGSKVLVAEPRGRVPETEFAASTDTAQGLGFRLDSRPVIRWSRAVVLVKT